MSDEAASVPDAASAAAAAAAAAAASIPPTVPKSSGLDPMAILAVVALLAAFIVPLVLLFRTQGVEDRKKDAAKSAAQAREDAALAKKQAKLDRGQGKKKKGGLARMQKGGGGAAALEEEQAAAGGGGRDDDDDDDDDEDAPGSRKDQRKAEKRAEHREQVEARQAQRDAIREQQDEKDAKRRAKDAEREAKEQAREQAEQERAAAIAKAKQEEYDKWKGMFEVDEAGEEGGGAVEEEGVLERFIAYMKEHKVTVLEELAAEFKLKVADVLDRVHALEKMGHITGVVDDRGKFIFITLAELESVAAFVKQRGRVRISTLAQESNRLIDLNAKSVDAAEDDDEAASGAAA